jgi:hypothetical protein
MQGPQTLRQLARRCRKLVMGGLTSPAVANQLRLWVIELADEADETERAAVSPGAERKHISRMTRSDKAPRRQRTESHPREQREADHPLEASPLVERRVAIRRRLPRDFARSCRHRKTHAAGRRR